MRSGCHCGALFVLRIRLQHDLSKAILRRSVACAGSQQREGALFAVDGIRSRRERDVPAAPGSALPDREADQLQAREWPFGEVQLRLRQLSWRVVLVVRCDFYEHGVLLRHGGREARPWPGGGGLEWRCKRRGGLELARDAIAVPANALRGDARRCQPFSSRTCAIARSRECVSVSSEPVAPIFANRSAAPS